MEIRLGLVGYGDAGRRRARAWRALSLFGLDAPGAVRFVAVSAPGGDAEAARREAGFEQAVGDPEEVIAHPDVDIVDICLPRAERASALRSAMAAGKHILCAHPLAGDDRDAEEIAALGGRIPGRKQMASRYLSLPAIQRARLLVRDGGIGEVQYLRVSARAPFGIGERDPEVGGSALYGLVPHALDVARALNGDVAEVSAQVEAMPDPNDIEAGATTESVACLLRFANGSAGALDAACSVSAAAESFSVEVFGAEGRVAFDLAAPDTLIVTRRDGHGVHLSAPDGAAGLDGEVAALSRFLHSVAYDDPTEPDFRDGLMVQRTLAAIVLSSEDGAWSMVELGR